MKKIISVIILCALILCGCNSVKESNITEVKKTVEQVVQQPAPEIKTDVSPKEPKQEKKEIPVFLPEETKAEEQEIPERTDCVSLRVDCSDILNDIESLKEEKRALIPEDGTIIALPDVEFTEGESVFDVLKRELTARAVHLEFELSPVVNNAYIEGIGNIYEFDCGERSGWKYSVNGEFPRVGCSDYKVKAGDEIVFVYKIKAY